MRDVEMKAYKDIMTKHLNIHSYCYITPEKTHLEYILVGEHDISSL